MKKQTLKERINEVTSQLKYFESEQERNPDRKLNKIITQLKAVKGTLEAMTE